jgi:hypothetical protein
VSSKRKDFGLNPEHPPLVKLLAMVPLLSMPFKMAPLLDRPYEKTKRSSGARIPLPE